MTVHDLWYLNDRDPVSGERLRSKRYGRGKRWRVSWEDPEVGGVKTKSFERKTDAETFDDNVGADISRGQYIDPKAGQIKVGEYFEKWCAAQPFRDSTLVRVKVSAKLHFLPQFCGMAIASVRPSNIQGWVKGRSSVIAPSTLSVLYSTVVAPMFKAATLDRIIGTTPCVGIKLPEIEEAEYYIAKPKQIHALAAALPERYRAVPYIASGCGWRAGEIFGSEKDSFDFLRREAKVVRQLTSSGHDPRLSPLKTKTSKRTNELPNFVLDALALHIERVPPRPIHIADVSNPRKPVERDAWLMFTTTYGKPVRNSSWSGIWRQIVAEVVDLPKGFGLRDLRHYFATALIWGGANVKQVQLAMGHANPMITLNTYTGYWPDAVGSTRTLLNEALSAGEDLSSTTAFG